MEPQLQQLKGEHFQHSTATGNKVRLDIKAAKKAFLDVRVHVENGSITHLIMSATKGMSRECKKFYSQLAEMICKKRSTM